MGDNKVIIERVGFLSWKVWVRPCIGHAWETGRFTRRGALRCGARALERDARRVASREVIDG